MSSWHGAQSIKARDNCTFILYVLVASVSLKFPQRAEERKEIAKQFEI
jgi:hypothetical protein